MHCRGLPLPETAKPGEQMQEADALLGLELPGGHVVHVVAPALLYVPAKQAATVHHRPPHACRVGTRGAVRPSDVIGRRAVPVQVRLAPDPVA